MGEEETVTKAVEASVNGICQPDEMDKILTEKKEIDENGVKEMNEDKKENEKGEALRTDEGSNSKEEKSTEEEQKEDVKADKENDSKEEKSKEEEQKEDVKADEQNDSKEEKNKEEEQKEAVKADEENDSTKEKESEKVEKKDEVGNDEEDKMKESKEEKEPKKRGGRKSVGGKAETVKRVVGKKDVKEPVTPAPFSLDRPVRERKSVERLVAIIEKEPTREFRIEKGRGTALKDIPNVAYKLRRKKTDETFKLLHVMLFGRKGKAFKNNLSQFSGFAWHENEEKQKIKIKEKLDKYVKEKLLEFCDVLDIRVAKATTRKEEMVAELLDFLAAPRATTDAFLAETEQLSKTTKRKRSNMNVASKSGGTTAKRSPRKRRKTDDTPKEEEKKDSHESEDESEEEVKENENGVSDGSEDEVAEHSESKDAKEKDDDSEEEKGKHKKSSEKSSAKKEASEKFVPKKTVTPKKSTAVSSPKKASSKSSSKHSKVVSSDTSPMVSSRKNKDVETSKRKYSSLSKSTTKEKGSKEKAGKKVVGGKDKLKEAPTPSEDELRNTISEILKEVDFNTATFTDILKRLARHFDMDLTTRKAAIKLLIQEELTKLADEEENEDEGESEKEEDPEPAGQKV